MRVRPFELQFANEHERNPISYMYGHPPPPCLQYKYVILLLLLYYVHGNNMSYNTVRNEAARGLSLRVKYLIIITFTSQLAYRSSANYLLDSCTRLVHRIRTLTHSRFVFKTNGITSIMIKKKNSIIYKDGCIVADRLQKSAYYLRRRIRRILATASRNLIERAKGKLRHYTSYKQL